MNPAVILSLISDLYGQVAAAHQQIDALTFERDQLAEERDKLLTRTQAD